MAMKEDEVVQGMYVPTVDQAEEEKLSTPVEAEDNIENIYVPMVERVGEEKTPPMAVKAQEDTYTFVG